MTPPCRHKGGSLEGYIEISGSETWYPRNTYGGKRVYLGHFLTPRPGLRLVLGFHTCLFWLISLLDVVLEHFYARDRWGTYLEYMRSIPRDLKPATSIIYPSNDLWRQGDVMSLIKVLHESKASSELELMTPPSWRHKGGSLEGYIPDTLHFINYITYYYDYNLYDNDNIKCIHIVINYT